MKKIKIFIICLFLVLIGVIAFKEIKKIEVPKFNTVRPEHRDIEESLVISGFVNPQKEIEIKSPISGILEELYVQVGDKVNKGDPIARVQYVKDPMEYKRLIDEIEINKIRLEEAESEYDRALLLYEEKLMAPSEYEKISRNRDVETSRYEATKSELSMLQGVYSSDISNVIIATDNGTVLELPVKEGGSVMARGTFNEGTSVAKIANLSSLIFIGDVVESNIMKLKYGMPMTFRMAISKEFLFHGHLSMISPKGLFRDGVSRFQITADISIPDSCREFVRAGSSANAIVVLKKKEQVLAIMDKYLHFDYDSVFVEKLNSKGSFDKTYLNLGISDGIWTEILNGVDDTDIIKITKDTD